MSFGGMQLLPAFRAALDPRFITWYRGAFNNTRMIYGHWPVECKNQDDGHYHRVVGLVTGQPTVWNNTPCDQDLDDHTYGRNTNSCALALAGFSGATTSDLGPECATPAQIDLYVQVVAETACNLRSPVSNFMSHGEAADDVDQATDPTQRSIAAGVAYPAPWAPDPSPYGPLTTWERWDLHVWIDPVTRALIPPRGGAIPPGAFYLPDYVRGKAAARIQDMTRQYWAPPQPPQPSP